MASLMSLSSILLYFHNNQNLFKRGENSYQSGNVKDIVYDSILKIIRGKVNASMKQRTYKTEISLTDENEVQAAKCECPRGLEICHHIAATLLATHYELSRTDGECRWAPKPGEASEVKTVDEVFNISKCPRVTNRYLNEEELRELFESLQELPPVGFRWLLRSHFYNDDEAGDTNNAILDSIDIQYFILSAEFRQADDKIYYLKQKTKLTSNTIAQILKITDGQANNVDWFVVRKSRITASNFGKVINAVNRNRFPSSLFTTLYEHKDLSRVRAIQWGITHEKEGLDTLRKLLKKDIVSCGIFLSESGVLGASPDGIVDEDYIVEIKCPFKYRSVLLSEALTNDFSFIVYFDDTGKMWLNKKHPYYHQVQGQIYLSNRKGCHLCIWTPQQAVHCLILKDVSWGCNLKLLEEFYFRLYVPFIVSQI